MARANDFTAANYDPQEWVKLIKDSGAKYTVITTKHHDGFALWDTKAGDVSCRQEQPRQARRHRAFAEAVRDAGLKLGFYYSLIGRPREDYPEIYRDKAPKYDIKKEPESGSTSSTSTMPSSRAQLDLESRPIFGLTAVGSTHRKSGAPPRLWSSSAATTPM